VLAATISSPVPRLAHLPRLAAALATCFAALALAPPAGQAQAGARPNIVFIMTDDQTARSLRYMTNVRLGLREQGTTFRHAVASFPLCCPSRATYLTGQYSHNTGVTHNVPPFGGYRSLDYTNTLPAWLQQAGYRTIHLGRWLNGYGTENPDLTEVPPGWNDWNSMIQPSAFDFSAWLMNENGRIVGKPGLDHPGEYQTDFLGRRGSELIAGAAPSPQPFFLSLTFPAPHSSRPLDPDDPPVLRTPSPAPHHRDAFAGTPLPRPPNFNERNIRDKPQVVADRSRFTGQGARSIEENYQQELEALLSVDEAVARVLGTLQLSGELENTLVIYTSDNGFFHGEHRVRSEKVLPYEPSIRVPLVMRGPGVPRGLKLSQLVANVDLAPTILEAAGAVPGRVQDGRSLLGLLGDPTLELGREVVLENGHGANRIPPYRGIRNDRFTYVRHGTTGEAELYDLREDPYQLQSLDEDEDYDRIRRLLAKRLRTLASCSGPACRGGRPAVRLRLRELVPRRGARRERPPQVRRVQSCVSRDLRLGVYGSEKKLVERIRYYAGARSLGSTRRPPFRRDVKRRRLPASGSLRLRARIATIDGRVITRDRVVRACRRR